MKTQYTTRRNIIIIVIVIPPPTESIDMLIPKIIAKARIIGKIIYTKYKNIVLPNNFPPIENTLLKASIIDWSLFLGSETM